MRDLYWLQLCRKHIPGKRKTKTLNKPEYLRLKGTFRGHLVQLIPWPTNLFLLPLYHWFPVAVIFHSSDANWHYHTHTHKITHCIKSTHHELSFPSPVTPCLLYHCELPQGMFYSLLQWRKTTRYNRMESVAMTAEHRDPKLEQVRICLNAAATETKKRPKIYRDLHQDTLASTGNP